MAGHGASHLFMKNLGVKQKSAAFFGRITRKFGRQVALSATFQSAAIGMNCITWTHKMDVLHIAGANHAPFF